MEKDKYLASKFGDIGMLDYAKFVGRPIKELIGHPSAEFGSDTPVFQLYAILFEDGTTQFIEGEHDMPYISTPYASDVAKRMQSFIAERDA